MPRTNNNPMRFAPKALFSACAFGVPFIASAEPSVLPSGLYLERDIMLFIVSISALLLFRTLRHHTEGVRTRPIGRRTSDLLNNKLKSTFSTSEDEKSHTFLHAISWESNKTEPWKCVTLEKPELWWISIFSVHKLVEKRRFSTDGDGLFLFSRTIAERERYLSPLQRKLVSRYRTQFSSIKTVHQAGHADNPQTWTWLPNEAAIWNVILGFVDECLTISDSIDCEASLCIGRGNEFWIEISWPNIETANWVRDIGLENPEIELIESQNSIGLRLYVAFQSSRTPSSTRAALGKIA